MIALSSAVAPRVGERDQHVAPGDHAEVAMRRLAGMDEEGGEAGRGEGRGDLAGDMAGFAHAADDHAAAGRDQQDLDRSGKILAQLVRKLRNARASTC